MSKINIYKKLLEAWASADNKEAKFQQLLEEWIKTVNTKDSYRMLLKNWIENDENLKNKFQSLLDEWAESEKEVPYQSLLEDWIKTELKGETYPDLLKEWIDFDTLYSSAQSNRTKQLLEEWLAKDLSDREDKSDE